MSQSSGRDYSRLGHYTVLIHDGAGVELAKRSGSFNFIPYRSVFIGAEGYWVWQRF